jgi:Polysaccharide biosynthesis protein
LNDPLVSSESDYTEPRPDHENEAHVVPAADQVERRGLGAAGQLVARTVPTRGIILLETVALARLLTPADFGVFAVITLIVTILTVVGDLGIGAGLVQQHDEPGTPTWRPCSPSSSPSSAGWGWRRRSSGPLSPSCWRSARVVRRRRLGTGGLAMVRPMAARGTGEVLRGRLSAGEKVPTMLPASGAWPTHEASSHQGEVASYR